MIYGHTYTHDSLHTQLAVVSESTMYFEYIGLLYMYTI